MVKSNLRRAQRLLKQRKLAKVTLASAMGLYLNQKERPSFSRIRRGLKTDNQANSRTYAYVAYLLSLRAARAADSQPMAAKSWQLIKGQGLATQALYQSSDARYLLARQRNKAVLEVSQGANQTLIREGLKSSFVFAQLAQARANAYLSTSGGLVEAEKNYKNAEILLNAYEQKTIHHAILFYNQALLNLNLKKYEAASKHGKAAIDALKRTRNANSLLHLKTMINLGLSEYYLKRFAEAGKHFQNVVNICDSLLIRRNVSCGKANHYYGLVLVKQNEKSQARKWFRSANRIYSRARERSLASAARRQKEVLRFESPHDPFETKLFNYLGFSYEEDDLLESYSAPRYRTNAAAFARTYGNRLDDTNVMLKDLLGQKSKSAALNKLRSQTLGKQANKKGRGLLFVDIGPAVANVIEPAVTSVNVAHDFSHMQVIALDLPSEFRRYHKKVLKSAKKRLRSYKNLHLFSGDGLDSLKKQFAKNKPWVFKDRAKPNLKETDLVVIRTANAIDIYVKYKYVRPAIARMAKDFKNKPVILFFNRSILFKPRNRSYFKIIGHLSVRGFHHNKRSLDRKGQRPYTLLSSQLVD